jgi:hypothetical protein
VDGSLGVVTPQFTFTAKLMMAGGAFSKLLYQKISKILSFQKLLLSGSLHQVSTASLQLPFRTAKE